MTVDLGRLFARVRWKYSENRTWPAFSSSQASSVSRAAAQDAGHMWPHRTWGLRAPHQLPTAETCKQRPQSERVECAWEMALMYNETYDCPVRHALSPLDIVFSAKTHVSPPQSPFVQPDQQKEFINATVINSGQTALMPKKFRVSCRCAIYRFKYAIYLISSKSFSPGQKH